MELMQLEMFVALVEERSVRRAAERVYRTQPAVSIAISKLQQEIGTLLLDDTRRTNRRLTKAGQILYEYASRIIVMRNEALSLLSGEDRRCVGNVRIGLDNEESMRLIAQLGAAFSRQHPRVRVATRQGHAKKLILELQDRKIDFALLSVRQKSQEVDSDLVVSPVKGFGRGGSLWLIQRPAYQSYTVKAFGAVLSSLSVDLKSPSSFVSGPGVLNQLLTAVSCKTLYAGDRDSAVKLSA